MKYTLSNENITITVDSLGAELVSLHKDGEEFMWSGDSAYWGRVSPVLFPIVGALRDGKYLYGDQSYVLPQHGFARDMEFSLAEQSADRLVFGLFSDDASLEVYPFEFILMISYTLEGNKVKVGYEVRNIDEKPLYFSIGAHPAFAIDPNGANTIEFAGDEKSDRVLLDGPLVSKESEPCLDGRELKLEKGIFDRGALVFDSVNSQSVTLRTGGRSLKVDFAGFEYLAFWAPKDAPFVCIEPWFGIADSVEATGKLEEKRGIRSLEVDESFKCEWSVEV